MIRKINNKDIEDINNLVNDFDNNFKNHYNLNYYIQNGNIYQVYVYDKNNIVKGIIISSIIQNELEILFLYVSKEERKKGIASGLINYLINNYDVNAVFLEVSSDNKVAINLYQKLGFEIYNIRKNYYANGSDALLMRKDK